MEKKKQGYIGFNLDFLTAPAMRNLSTNCHKLLHFLMIEHLKKGWAENGELIAPYNQLEDFGISRRYINRAIYEAEQRGLIIVERGARIGGRNYNNRYYLTFAHSKERKASNNWKNFSEQDFQAFCGRRKKQKEMLRNDTNLVSLCA